MITALACDGPLNGYTLEVAQSDIGKVVVFDDDEYFIESGKDDVIHATWLGHDGFIEDTL